MFKKYVFPAMFCLPVFFIACYNIKNNSEFWLLSVGNVFTFLIGIWIAYFMTQRKTDERKIKQIAEEIICEIMDTITLPKCFVISDKSSDSELLMLHRKISNRLEHLKIIAVKGVINEKILKNLSTEFMTYREFVGDHIDDKKYLSSSEKELLRYSENIENYLYLLRIALYK